MVNLVFRTHYASIDNTSFALVGSLPGFGCWIPAKAIHATQHPEGTWEAKVSIRPDQDLEFKWVIISGDEAVRWEERPNRCIKTPFKHTVYTSMWNEELEITEVVNKSSPSPLRNRKRVYSPVSPVDQEDVQDKAEIRGSLVALSSNLCQELKSVRRMSSVLQRLTAQQTLDAKKYSTYNSRISCMIAICLVTVVSVSLLYIVFNY